MRPRHTIPWILLLVTAVPAAAFADNRWKAEAERRNTQASNSYQNGHYQVALRGYQSAYDLFPDPRYQYNIALAKRKLLDYEGCVVAFRQFIASSKGKKRATARKTAKKHARVCLARTEIPVRFTSVPTNAAIRIRENGVERQLGRTPQTLKLRPGPHQIVVTLPGYVAEKRTVPVKVGKRPQVDFVLEKMSSLRIEVDPSGAQVKIGTSQWQTAPVTRQVQAGEYKVRIEKDGYAPSRRRIKVEAGQEVALVLSLRKLPTIRTLTVATSTPVDKARVRIDGSGRGAPPVASRLSPGTYRVLLEAPGHIPYAANIRVPANRDVRVLVHLTPARSKRNRRTLWSFVGAVGLTALVGTTYGILALSDQSAFNDDPTNVPLHNRGENRARNADLWLGGAAIISAGAALYYLLTRPAKSTSRID